MLAAFLFKVIQSAITCPALWQKKQSFWGLEAEGDTGTLTGVSPEIWEEEQ